jgi:5-methylcytosine-specific restriction endonuclease McrA
MVRVYKKQEPDTLRKNKTNWTDELMSYIRIEQKVPENIKNKYNHSDIKEILRLETNGQCMYCESDMKHITHEHIEHIKPKAKDKYPHLTFEWFNLGLACPICNLNKSDIYDENLPFINPYQEDPKEYLYALGTLIFHLPGNKRGELMWRQIGLNRPELIEKRFERIESVKLLIDKYSQELNTTLKNVLLNQIRIEASDDKPYSMCIKALIEVELKIIL